MHRTMVDFPAPFSPTRASISPACRSKATSRRTWRRPNRLCRSRTRNTGIGSSWRATCGDGWQDLRRMKPAPFDYVAPTTVEEVVAVLAEHGDEAKVVAGGQSLVPMMALRLARP